MSTARRLEKYQVMEIGRLIGIKKFEGERERILYSICSLILSQ